MPAARMGMTGLMVAERIEPRHLCGVPSVDGRRGPWNQDGLRGTTLHIFHVPQTVLSHVTAPTKKLLPTATLVLTLRLALTLTLPNGTLISTRILALAQPTLM